LKQEVMKKGDIKEENERLKKILNYKESTDMETVVARVIGATLKVREKTIMIDLGTNSGIKKDFAVISPVGLIGVVIKSYPNSSLVRLINDQKSGVSAQILETRDIGVVEGTPGGRLALRYLPFGTEVENKNKVLTSGIGGIFPKGIYIGEVEIPDKKTFRMEKEVYIKSEVDFDKIEEVLVVMKDNPQEGE
jgi:rod shape-determining protein MreC